MTDQNQKPYFIIVDVPTLQIVGAARSGNLATGPAEDEPSCIGRDNKIWPIGATFQSAMDYTGKDIKTLRSTCLVREIAEPLFNLIQEALSAGRFPKYDLASDKVYDVTEPVESKPETEYIIHVWRHKESGRFTISPEPLKLWGGAYDLISSSPVRAASVEDALSEIQARYIFVDGKPVEPNAKFWFAGAKTIVNVESIDYDNKKFTCTDNARSKYTFTFETDQLSADLPKLKETSVDRIIEHADTIDYKAVVKAILTEIAGRRWNSTYQQMSMKEFGNFLESTSKSTLFFHGVENGQDILAQRILAIIKEIQ